MMNGGAWSGPNVYAEDPVARAEAEQAQSTADAALPKAGGQITGNITCAGAQTFDGVDVSTLPGLISTAQSTADAALARIETPTWPVSTNLKAATSTDVTDSVTGRRWTARIFGTTGAVSGGPSVFEIDSAGRGHCTWAANTATGSGNYANSTTKLGGPRLLTSFAGMMPGGTSYLEIETSITLDSGQSNQVSSANSFSNGLHFLLRASNFADTAVSDFNHIRAGVLWSTGDVTIGLRETLASGASLDYGSVTGYAGSMVTGVDVKVRITSAGVVLMYYRVTGSGSAYTLVGSVPIGDYEISAWGLQWANATATTGAGGNMDIRMTPPTITRYLS